MTSTSKPARPGTTRLPLLVLTLAFVLAASCPSHAHRPYFTQAGPVVLPDGQPGEMRLLKGDGIFFADPARILVLDREGRLLARSYQSTAMTLLCDRDQRSCSGYDGFRVLTLDAASFRSGAVVPGLGRDERSELWAFENGAESWGFTVGWATVAQVAEGEVMMARQWPRALALLATLGAVAALFIMGMSRSLGKGRPSSALRAISALLCLSVLAPVLFVAFYLALLTGFSMALWLVGLGSGAVVMLLARQLLRRSRTVA